MEHETFRKGVGLHGAKARRVLMRTGHLLLEALQDAKEEAMMELCRKHQRLVLSNEQVTKGFAWHLRMADPRGGKLLPHDLLQGQPRVLDDHHGRGELGLPCQGQALFVEGD